MLLRPTAGTGICKTSMFIERGETDFTSDRGVPWSRVRFSVGKNMADSLSGIDLFVTVAEAGSFSAAAERLNITRSAVGKGIVRLEQRLGTQLFQRSLRNQSLTDEGAIFFRHCLRALEEVRAGEAALESGRWNVHGRLRVSVPALFGQLCLSSILLDLAREHPGLALDMILSDRVVDLVEEGVDLAVRIGMAPESAELAIRQLGEHRMTFCASPAYVRERGMPSLETLQSHDGVAYTNHGRLVDWQFRADGQVQSVRPNARLQVDDMRVVADAAIAGFGIAWIPSWLARRHLESGELVQVLSQLESAVFAINAVWPRTAHLPMKTQVVVEELSQRLPDSLALIEP